MQRHYLSADVDPVHGRFKATPEDFQVDEIPLIEPLDVGEYVHFRVRKRMMSTFEAIRRLALASHVRDRDFSFAGLKDARAVTTQTLAVRHPDPEFFERLEIRGLRILEARRHPTGLRIGDLIGNRFCIRIRGVRSDARERVAAVLDILESRGVPNYFGEQRFRVKINGATLGRLILQRDCDSFVQQFIGEPDPRDDVACRRARRLFLRGRHAAAAAIFPKQFSAERKCLRILAQTGDMRLGYNAIPVRIRRFFVGVYQSMLFNRFLDRRVTWIDRLIPGDVVLDHHGGFLFVVRKPLLEEPRVERFEMSPTGPIFGPSMVPAHGPVRTVEADLLAQEGIDISMFENIYGFRERGTRRALRFRLCDLDVRHTSNGFVLSFQLAKGCYATSVLDEIFKGLDKLGTVAEETH